MRHPFQRLEKRFFPELSLDEPDALPRALGTLVTGEELGYVIRAPRKRFGWLPGVRRDHGRRVAAQVTDYLEALGGRLSTEDEVPFAGSSPWHFDRLPKDVHDRMPSGSDPAMIAVWRAERGVTKARMTRGNNAFWDHVARRDPARHPAWSLPEEVVDYLDVGVVHPWAEPVMHETVLRAGDTIVFYLDGAHNPTLHRFTKESFSRRAVSSPYEVSATALVAASAAVGAGARP